MVLARSVRPHRRSRRRAGLPSHIAWNAGAYTRYALHARLTCSRQTSLCVMRQIFLTNVIITVYPRCPLFHIERL